MESRAKLLGHPIHQMLIVFPLGLLAMAVIFDLLLLTAQRRLTRWQRGDSPAMGRGSVLRRREVWRYTNTLE